VSVTAASGFVAGGAACGIKATGAPDLAIVATAGRRAVPAAAVFTTNRVQAAPVQVSREHLDHPYAAAVVLNSGNANAATGKPGLDDAQRMCELTAAGVGCATTDVLVCSTGLIGFPLPMGPVEAGIPGLAASLRATPEGGTAFADAILTTDTVRKEATAAFDSGGVRVTVGGAAKGAAMLSPAMATMLAVLTTDAAASPEILQHVLAEAVDVSFNRLVVDGSRSTNDAVMLIANGAAGAATIERDTDSAYTALLDATTDVCRSLATAMARDAEGATKLARVVVQGARTDHDAVLAARQVAGSQLVQCSLYGEDPYWGRILSELGASGADLDPDVVDISYNGVTVCRDGVAAAHDADALRAAMAAREIEIRCDLSLGAAEASVLFSDLTHAYIDENKDTS
jgi:glutamate N-acetyltransferase/amino-acid N-acetyltransferase